LVEILFEKCAIGIKILIDKIIKNGDVTVSPTERAENRGNYLFIGIA